MILGHKAGRFDPRFVSRGVSSHDKRSQISFEILIFIFSYIYLSLYHRGNTGIPNAPSKYIMDNIHIT